MTSMKLSSLRFPSIIASLCLLSSSCVTYTAYQDEPRRKVSFSSARAAQTFYDAYASVDTPYGNGNVFVTLIPIYPPYRTTPKENIKFNAAIQSADTNHNNIISEKEAQAYSTTIAEGRKQEWEDSKF